MKLTELGKIGDGLGEALGAGVETLFQFLSLLPELFFEEGIEHDGGGAGVFEAANSADVLRQRRGGGDEWSAQLHSEIFCAHVHDVPSFQIGIIRCLCCVAINYFPASAGAARAIGTSARAFAPNGSDLRCARYS